MKIDEFLEAAPVPLGLPAEEVERRLGPATKTLQKEGHPTGYEYPGLWLAIEDGVVASVSFLTGGADHGGAKFEGALPGGLKVTDPPARVGELYGEPDRVQEVGLPRPPRAKLVLHFYALTAPATMTFAYKTQEPSRLDRIVLSRRPT
jgi:hypothetical protein